MFDDEIGGVVECHEAAHCGGYVGYEVVFGLDAWLEVKVLEAQGCLATLEFGVEAPDEPIIMQDGEAEVAPYTLRRWLVCLKYLLKAPRTGCLVPLPRRGCRRERGMLCGLG